MAETGPTWSSITAADAARKPAARTGPVRPSLRFQSRAKDASRANAESWWP